MNRNNYRTYRVLTPASAWLGLLLLGLGAGNVVGQTAEDYSANPPFGNSDENSPSGASSTIAALEASGLSVLYQTFYHKSYTDIATGKSIGWGGVLDALFIDESGRFREDNGIKGKLEDTSIDYVVDIFNDESVSPSRSRFRRFQQIGGGSEAILNSVGVVEELDALHTVWNARDILAGITQDDLAIQRPLDPSSGLFAEDAGNKRFIFTYLDVPGLNSSGEVDSGEVIDFVPAIFNPDINSNWRYMGLADRSDAMDLVKYVRGQDIPGWRSRLVDFPGDDSAVEKYWLLGDIANSTPLVVNAPQERYDLVYADTTYKKFKEQYAHRRQMVYAGANDGMLHAFNGGVWNAKSRLLQMQSYVDPSTSAHGQAHKLGAEMWAYVPMNLLPHLQWLKAPDYAHVYFMDASPQSFDVNIFADDTTHPGGWGTILVAGMGFGGGDFVLDLDADDIGETVRTSAVVIMDITDPERPPVLLAELASPELGFTTGAPALLKARRPDASGSYAAPAMNKWVLILGSGPQALATATSPDQKPALLAWDLQTRKYIHLAENLQTPATASPGFYGSFAPADLDSDYVDDVVYVGTVEGTEQAPAGRLKRILLNASAPGFGLADGSAHLSTVINVAKPIVAKPALVHSYAKNENWLLFGTGRSFTFNDYHSAAAHRLFGIKEAADLNTTLELASLIDSTNILVQPDVAGVSSHVWDGEVNNDLHIDDARLDTFHDLFEFMDGKNGWYRNLRSDLTAPAERVVNNVLMLRSSVIFTSYVPEPASSEHDGESFLYALNYRTGTADETGLLGADNASVLLESISVGAEELTQPVLKITQRDEPTPDRNPDGQPNDEHARKVSLVAGSDQGNPESIEFHLPAASMRRLSWELIESAFQGD